MLSLPSKVVVLGWDTSATSDRSAHKIAASLGAEATFVCLTKAALRDGASIGKLVPRCTCLIVDAETLAKAADAMQAEVGGLRTVTCSAEHVLIYGFQPTGRHAAILRALSSGSLLGVRPLPDSNAKFHVAEGHRKWCGQFSGLSLGAVDPTRENSFLEGTELRPQVVMIRVGDKPFFVRMQDGGSQVYFLASTELADLDEKVQGGARLLSWFSRLVPLMMFLRGALGNRAWHNDQPRACFIIDDPPLKNRYGFLQYSQLVEVMRQQRFSSCIAFIPWNYRRSSKEVTELFSSCGMPYLCVHGCDHTGAEFATSQFESLCGKAQLALDRMRAHCRLSGLPFDDIMIFPQGLFSVEAMMALNATGYLAAVNTHMQPSTMPEDLALRDLLEVAVTKFADFPLFSRCYPHDLEDLAFYLFVGKPALAVEHHGYFRNGYSALRNFVARLNALDERLEWTNLATICSHACLTRTADDGDVYVRFYTSRFRLKNDGTQTHRYILLRRQTPDGPVPSVTINGRRWDHEREEGNLKIRLSLDAGQTAEIRVLSDGPDSVDFSCPQTTVHNARVRLRRMLCEFRDNYVDTNRVLSGIVSTARKIRNVIRGLLQAHGTSNMKRYLWNFEFSRGRWTGPDNTPDDCVYPYIERHVNKGSILDLGCGRGNTGNELTSIAYRDYTGVDISDVAIARARRTTQAGGRSDKNHYLQSDISAYVPTQQFDVILFRDSIYYVAHAKVKAVLRRYSKYLKEGAVFIVRLWDWEGGCGNILDTIESNFEVVEKDFYHEPKKAIVIVFRPSGSEASVC